MNRRVSFVAPFGLGKKTTVWARILPLARQLAVQGWSPTIVIPPWDTPTDAGRRWLDHGVHIVHTQIDGGVPATLYRLLHEANKTQPDLIHIVKPRAYAGLTQWWLWQQRKRGQPTSPILLDTDDWEQAWGTINRYPWPVARFLAWQEEWGIRHADGISAASRWLVNRVRQANQSSPLLYLPNGIDPAQEIGLGWQHGGSDVLFFSRFVEVTPEWLAFFWRALHEHHPAAHLLIAGAPVRSGLDRAFRQVIELVAPEAAAQVKWLGYVNQVQMERIYRRVGCAIFPAAPTVLQQAKCSVRLATTLLSGAPVVASAVGEQVTYGAAGAARLVAADASPQRFADAVAEVLAAPAEQTALGETARHHLLTRYNWQALGAQLGGFYQQISNQNEP